MAKLKFHITRAGLNNPKTRQPGFIARVVTNGTVGFDDIAAAACHNTTMHKGELRLAFELGIEAVAEKLMQGYIVDLGPIGKLYPSCSSKWVPTIDELKLANVKPDLYYRPGGDVAAAIRGARLVWAKQEDEAEEDDDEAEEDDGGLFVE